MDGTDEALCRRLSKRNRRLITNSVVIQRTCTDDPMEGKGKQTQAAVPLKEL